MYHGGGRDHGMYAEGHRSRLGHWQRETFSVGDELTELQGSGYFTPSKGRT